jgi:opacity protein-like surface antigen
MATAATVALAVAAPSTANAWEWPWAGWFTDEMAVDQPPGSVDDTPVTFGTGWYLRGDGAISQDVQMNFAGALVPKNTGFPNSWSLGVGAGYKYNSWLRSDLTLDWRAPRTFQGNVSTLACQISASPIYGTKQIWVEQPPTSGNWAQVTVPDTTNITGSNPVNSTCMDYRKIRETNATLLVNTYFDLGTWYGLTPYIGAGVGFNVKNQTYQRNWYFANGNPYSPTSWVDPATNVTITNSWDYKASKNSITFAWALMAGASYNITNHLALDLGLRYLNLGTAETAGLVGAARTYTAKEMRFGFRYTPD